MSDSSNNQLPKKKYKQAELEGARRYYKRNKDAILAKQRERRMEVRQILEDSGKALPFKLRREYRKRDPNLIRVDKLIKHLEYELENAMETLKNKTQNSKMEISKRKELKKKFQDKFDAAIELLRSVNYMDNISEEDTSSE